MSSPSHAQGAPGREKAIRDVFTGALDEPPEARFAYVTAACSGDHELARRVMELLAALGEAGEYLSSPSIEMRPIASHDGSGDLGENESGLRIGPYKLLEKIGEGGFGLVYMAEQERPMRRRVALKIIRAGMDSKQVIARFEAERQALALMDHPSIAKVLDAGTTEKGRPYFVMELVRGLPITRYCDENRLTPRERLELLMPVCRAVQHAHNKGVIHRDIKPGNVLVTLHDGKPVPKVIDFGIAKAISQPLTDRTLFTEFRAFVGTPAYMSPEQAEMSGLDIDTRSDVYSLGVLMYELLTGSTPFDAERLLKAGVAEIQRIIRDEEPARPSTRLSTLGERLTAIADRRRTEPGRLGRLLRGDVDWIVMRAMEKERTRRYETAESLAADIGRYLEGQPVVAGPPGAAYKLRRFVTRNKGAVAAGGIVVAAVLAGLGLSLWGFMQAAADRDKARIAESEQTKAADQAIAARKLADLRAARARLAAQVAQVGAEFIDWGLGFASPAFAGEGDARAMTMPELADACAARVGTIYKGEPMLEAAAHYHLGRMYTALGRVEESGDQLRAAMTLWDKHGLPDEVTYVTACSELEFAEYQRCVGPRDGNILRVRKFAFVLAYLESESSRFAAPLAAWGKALLASPRADEGEIQRAWEGVQAAWKIGPPARNSDELLLVVDAMCAPVCKVAIEGRSYAARVAGLEIAREIGVHCPEQFTRNVECLFMALGLVAYVDTEHLLNDRLVLCDRLMSSNLGAVARDHWVQNYARFYKGRTLIRLGKREEGEALMLEGCLGLRRARGMEDGYFRDSFATLLAYTNAANRYELLRSFETDPSLPLSDQVRDTIRAAGLPGFKAAAMSLAAAIRVLGSDSPEVRRRLLRVLVTPMWSFWEGWQLDSESGVAITDALLEQDPGNDHASRLAYATFQLLRADAASYVKDYELSERLLTAVLPTRIELIGEENWVVASTRAKLGGTHILQGRFEQGEREVQDGYTKLVAMVGANFGDSLMCVRRLANAWASTGRASKIADLMEQWTGQVEGNQDPEPALASARRAAWELIRRPSLPKEQYERGARALQVLLDKYKGRLNDRFYHDLALWRTGRGTEAIKDLRALDEETSKSRSGREPMILVVLAGVLHQVGDHEGATRAFVDAGKAAQTQTFFGTERIDFDELSAEIGALMVPPAR